MRHTTLIGILGLATSAWAQSWCTPGATWTYDINGWVANTQDQYTYVLDTFYEGRMAHKVQALSIGLTISGNTYFESWTEYTAVEDDIVWVWSNYGATPSWDTLYWFGAQVGDRWWPPSHPQQCPPIGMLEVIAVGDTTINGIVLSTITVMPLDQSGVPCCIGWGGGYKIIERIGSTPRLLDHSQICDWIIEYPFILSTCYEDQEIQFSGGWGCSFTVNSNDLVQTHAALFLHPNPGTTTFHLTGLAPRPAHLRLLDMQGRVVLETNTVMDERPVDANALPAGAYVVEVTTEVGRQVLRWVKD